MEKLTDSQIEILAEVFPYISGGSRRIAIHLLKDGSCTVAGTTPIWIGGVGNFIKVEDAGEGFVECSRYTLNINSFISSAFVKEFLNLKREGIKDQIKDLKEQESKVLERLYATNVLINNPNKFGKSS